MKLLDDYFNSQQKLYDYFDYEEGWVVYPIDDATEYYWYADDDEVVFSPYRDVVMGEERGEEYSNTIYKTRHLPKHVYEANEYTMIVVDSLTDGNKFLQVFDNNKRV